MVNKALCTVKRANIKKDPTYSQKSQIVQGSLHIVKQALALFLTLMLVQLELTHFRNESNISLHPRPPPPLLLFPVQKEGP